LPNTIMKSAMITKSIIDGSGNIIEKMFCLSTYVPLRLMRGLLYELMKSQAKRYEYQNIGKCVGFAIRRLRIDNLPLFSILPDGNKVIMRLGDISSFGVLKDIYDSNIYERFYKPTKDNIVIDIGAHVDFFTLKSAKQSGKRGLVVAVEPDQQNLRTLIRNIRLSHQSNIIVVNAALGNLDGKSAFYMDDYFSAGSSLYRPGIGKEVEVTVCKLDTLIRKIGVERVDLIKMDAEGSEVDIIRGAAECLEMRVARNLAIAAYHVSERAQKFIVEQLQRHGYRVLLTAEGYIYASLDMNISEMDKGIFVHPIGNS